jgi:hypothetical protein
MRLRLAGGVAGIGFAILTAAACGARTGLPLSSIAFDDAGLDDGQIHDATLGDRVQHDDEDATPDGPTDSSADVPRLDGFPPLADVVLPLCKALDAGQVDAAPCTGLACQVPVCGAGQDTTITGVVYAPNGELPLFNVEVFIPNAPLEAIPRGVQCSQCGDNVSGNPITTAFSLPNGEFTLTGVPAGEDIPIVVQLGKWRRMATIPKVEPCTNTALTDTDLTRFPRNQTEGSMPHVALTTGGCDQMGCMLTKLGIDTTEFGAQKDGYEKAIHLYYGAGGGVPTGATAALNLWGDATNLATYDEAIFSCECDESPTTKGGGFGAPSYGIVTDYLNAGGRIFTTDFQYVWYKYSPDPKIGETMAGSSTTGLGDIAGGAPAPATGGDQPPLVLSTVFPKSVALADWLKYVFSGVRLPSGATYPLDSYVQMGEVSPDFIFCNIQTLNPAETVLWASSAQKEDLSGGCTGESPGPRVFTVDTPVESASDEQCGRAVHIDAHIDNDGQTVGIGYPATGCSTTLKADEAAFVFFFFDLSSCSETCD